MSFDWQSKNRCLLSSFTFRFASYSASSCGSLRRCSGCCSSLLTSAKAAARAVEASSGTPTAAGEGDDDDGCMVFFCFSVEERERGAAVFFLYFSFDFVLRLQLLAREFRLYVYTSAGTSKQISLFCLQRSLIRWATASSCEREPEPRVRSSRTIALSMLKSLR